MTSKRHDRWPFRWEGVKSVVAIYYSQRVVCRLQVECEESPINIFRAVLVVFALIFDASSIAFGFAFIDLGWDNGIITLYQRWPSNDPMRTPKIRGY